MVAWHEMPGKGVKEGPVPEGRYDPSTPYRRLLQAPWVDRSPNLVRTNHTVPYRTDLHIAAFQAFHARLPS
jgi:hypothetical protein